MPDTITPTPEYALYKPLRNYLRQFPVMDSLEVIRAYLQNLQFRQEMPNNIELTRPHQYGRRRMGKGIYEWELDIISKEIILNGDTNVRYSLRKANCIAQTINMLRELENDLHGAFREIMQPNILLETYRISHRQFPWQRGPDERALVRYFKIFGHDDFTGMLENVLHMTASELYTFGLALVGNYMTTFGFNATGVIQIPNVRPSAWESFKNTFASTLPQLRQEIASAQVIDQDYAYLPNPLRYKPLIYLNFHNQTNLVAPIPTFLYQAFTDGVYYRLVNEREFANIFGPAFQHYVGDVLKVCNIRQNFTVLPEEEYIIGDDRHDTVDWIVSDATGDLFLECKAKRLRQESRIRIAPRSSLASDLETMGKAVAQVYTTLNDALNGAYPTWRNRNLPIYPVVVTLEEWYLNGMYGSEILPIVDRKAREILAAQNIDLGLLDRYPYTVISVNDLELTIQIIERNSIETVMTERCRGVCKDWMFYGFLLERFRGDFQYLNTVLFPEEWQRINPLVNYPR